MDYVLSSWERVERGTDLGDELKRRMIKALINRSLRLLLIPTVARFRLFLRIGGMSPS